MSNLSALLPLLLSPPTLWVVLAFFGTIAFLVAAALLARNRTKQERLGEAVVACGIGVFVLTFGGLVVLMGGNFN